MSGKRTRKGNGQPVAGNSDIAVALSYDGSNTPRVTAKGNDGVADEILRIAQAHDIPLYPNPELATALVQIPLGEEVPESLYRAVAEVIAFAYIVAGKMPDGFRPPSSDSRQNTSLCLTRSEPETDADPPPALPATTLT